jgi:hypothetical protein
VRVLWLFFWGLSLVLLLASTCPSPEPIPPPRLSAPILKVVELTPERFYNGFRPSVHMHWSALPQDSSFFSEFVLLQMVSGDSGFSILRHSIPHDVHDYSDNIDRTGFPTATSFKTMYYRIFGIDSLGRQGDTSMTDSIILCWPPHQFVPAESDTLYPDTFVWSVSYISSGFFSYMSLYNDSTGFLWRGPVGEENFINESDTVRYAQKLPSTLPRLVAGGYSWAVKVETATRAQSMAIGRFYVP